MKTKTKKRKRTTEITIETDEFLVTRSARQPALVKNWCAACAREVQMMTPEEAASVAGVSARMVYRWVEAGKVHFAETGAGLLLICLRSVVQLKPGHLERDAETLPDSQSEYNGFQRREHKL